MQSASISANIVMDHNEVSLSTFQQACNVQDLMLVKSIWLNPETLQEEDTEYMRDIYVILDFTHNLNRLNIRLGHPPRGRRCADTQETHSRSCGFAST